MTTARLKPTARRNSTLEVGPFLRKRPEFELVNRIRAQAGSESQPYHGTVQKGGDVGITPKFCLAARSLLTGLKTISLIWLLCVAPISVVSADLSTAQLDGPADRLLVNLMMEGRLAWFSWMGQPGLKPKLIVEWTSQGQRHTKTWQHGVEGSIYPQAFFLARGNEPGRARWGGHADLGSGREGHKHHFFSKDSPARCGFVKADVSEIPTDATIVRAELIVHIHDSEGLKESAEPDATGIGRFHHVNKEWDWDHLTFTHYAAGRPWSTPIETYPFLGVGDVSPVLWSLHRQNDLAARGYHKRGMRDYPLDLTAYLARLQELRSKRSR
jgi:hypothetical protein